MVAATKAASIGAGRRTDADLHRLSGVTNIGFASETNARAFDAILFKRRDRVALETLVNRGDRSRIDGVLMADLGHDLIGAPIDGEETERRKISGIGRHDAGFHADEIHHRRRLRRSRAAER